MPSKKRSETSSLPASRAGLSFYYSQGGGQGRGIKIKPEFVPIIVFTFIIVSIVANAFLR